MTTVRLAFNPADLTKADDAWPAFQAGGVVLKLWALWKRNHATSQHFAESLHRLRKHFRKVNKGKAAMYENIDQFLLLLEGCGFPEPRIFATSELRRWVVANWDYFNPHIRREVVMEYEAVGTVVQRLDASSYKQGGAA